MRLISVVPGLAISAKVTGKVTSPAIVNGSPVASSSRVRATTPSTEFSIGTSANCASPERTALSAAVTFAYGIFTSVSQVILFSAASVKVPTGPK
ncbi:unannotated protein [freshwater metagenome]|uniref:Unannotated protein n=1 Tax=freshwater metagenome TaxID=449393 RepID=A0A6J7KSF1_9ZZZZ